MAKILVLGGDGFMGSHLIDELFLKGHAIRAFSRFFNDISSNLEHLRGKIEFFSGDFLNTLDLKNALKDIDYVFHMISLSTPASTMNNPFIDINTNLIGTLHLLDLCVENKIKKIIFPSSGGTVYGEAEGVVSEQNITNPICPYGISKLAIEKYLMYFQKLHGLDYLILRISNPYGPRQKFTGSQGVISIFLNLIKQNKEISVFGDGNNIRDYLYINDLSKFIAEIFDKQTKLKLYNVASGEGHSINDIIAIMKNNIKNDLKVKYLEPRQADLKKVILDIAMIKEQFGFSSSVQLQDGICKTWNYINKL